MESLKGGLLSLVLGGVVALGSNNALGGLEFPTSGVWSQPRIYSLDGSKETEVDYSSLKVGEDYRFKARVDNLGETVSESGLLGEVIGPEYLSNNWQGFNVNPGSNSVRYWTSPLSQKGDYILRFSLDDGSYIERDFSVVPEPTTFGLLGLGALALKKRKESKSDR